MYKRSSCLVYSEGLGFSVWLLIKMGVVFMWRNSYSCRTYHPTVDGKPPSADTTVPLSWRVLNTLKVYLLSSRLSIKQKNRFLESKSLPQSEKIYWLRNAPNIARIITILIQPKINWEEVPPILKGFSTADGVFGHWHLPNTPVEWVYRFSDRRDVVQPREKSQRGKSVDM